MAAAASVWCAAQAEGTTLDAERLREALASFAGVKRRFEFYVNTPKQVYMDDYAHHPRELAATLTSVRKMFPGRASRRCSSRTSTRGRATFTGSSPRRCRMPTTWCCCRSTRRARSRSKRDVGDHRPSVTVPCRIVERAALADTVAAMDTDVVVSFGAGNIDACCGAIAES
mgnify:CR=1 FL=1